MKSQFVNLAIAALLFTACSEDLNVDVVDSSTMMEKQTTVSTETDSPYVSESQALFVAEKFQNIPLTRSNGEANVQTIFNENNSPLMYIINYPDNRFIIVGATRNYYPILAYSDKNNFSLNQESGCVEWLNETTFAIKDSENQSEEIISQMKFLWNFYEEPQTNATMQTRATSEEDQVMMARVSELRNLYPGYSFRPLSQCSANDFPLYGADTYAHLCNLASDFSSPLQYTICAINNKSYTQAVDPLLQTAWGQGSPLNNLYAGHDIGCVTVAMAQIMKFHQFPYQYVWGNIPNNQANTNILIADLVSALGINPNQDQVGVAIDKAKTVFESFQYSVTKKSHNASDVENELTLRERPVYMRGTNSSTGSGHAWVCDGVSKTKYETSYFIECRQGGAGSYYYYMPESPNSIESTGNSKFHMNWGWNGNGDGWFLSNNVNSINGNYQGDRTNLYVTPNN